MIDVIIPVYNTPLNDLERCLNSVLNQTFTNYKVYIIDDGSNIETKEYLDKFVSDKLSFIVKHIPNGGVSNARNLGIDISNSKYITFVDADDTLENNFFSEAYKLIEDNDLDIIIGGYNEIKNNEIVRVRVSEPGLHIYENEDIVRFLDKLLCGKTNETNKEIKDTPTGRIYTRLFKRESIGNLRFNINVHMSEDTLFMIDYTYQAKRIGITDKVWYNYYINDYSVSNGTINNEPKRLKIISAISGFIKEVEERKSKEENKVLVKAYQARIDRATNYMNDIKNNR